MIFFPLKYTPRNTEEATELKIKVLSGNLRIQHQIYYLKN